LLRIFEEVREVVLSDQTRGADRLVEVSRRIEALADDRVDAIDKIAADEMPNLILYRRRFDVLMASSFLSASGVHHRLRMGSMPVCIFPWVAATLSEYLNPSINENEFSEHWQNLDDDELQCGWKMDEAWALLYRFAGSSRNVDLLRLRRVLARPRPPVEFCSPDFGYHGPIVGTIHASKGREAGIVALYLPRGDGSTNDKSQSELDEESRVLFVGATRARDRLVVGQAYSPWPSTIDGRVYRLDLRKGQPKAQVEIGREYDVNPSSCVGNLRSESAAREQQRRIAMLAGRLTSVVAIADPDKSYRYGIFEPNPDAPLMATLHENVNRDLFQIAEKISPKLNRKLRPPIKIPHLYTVGVRSVVFSEDHPSLGMMPPPFCMTGMVLAPMIKGLPSVYFPNRR
jgi:hypothetical protein